jgi:hypothetical protein
MTDDVQFANRRLDASGNDALIGMARMSADAFGLHLCLTLHYEAAREAGIPLRQDRAIDDHRADALGGLSACCDGGMKIAARSTASGR